MQRCNGMENQGDLIVASAGCKMCCEGVGAVGLAGVSQGQAVASFREKPLLCLSHKAPTGLMKDSGLMTLSYFSTLSSSFRRRGVLFPRKTESKC